MPNYLHRTSKAYMASVSPASLPEPEANYIQDPDLSAVEGYPSKYWTVSGDTVTLMSQADRDAVDAAEKTARFYAVVGESGPRLFPDGTNFSHKKAEVLESAIAVLFEIVKGTATANTHKEVFDLIAARRAADQGVSL